MELGQAKGDGFYGRIGGSVSFLPWVEDRDTHVLSDTDYHNTYRLGWYVRPEIAVGVGLGETGGAGKRSMSRRCSSIS